MSRKSLLLSYISFIIICVVGCGEDPPGLTSIIVIGVDSCRSTSTELETLQALRLDSQKVEVIWSEEKNGEQERVVIDTQQLSAEFHNADVEFIIGQFAAPPGFIHQVRFILSDAASKVSGQEEELDLKTPSGEQSGLKLVPMNSEPFVTKNEGTTFLKAQFKFDERVVRQGNGRFLLKPTIPTIQAEISDEGYNPNVLWVQFNPGVTRSQIDDLNAEHIVIVTHAYPSLGNRYRLRLPVDFAIEDAYEFYEGRSEVDHVAPAAYGRPDQVNDAEAQDNQRAASIPEAWDISYNAINTVGSPSVVIAIIDNGVDISHKDLAMNIWINENEIPADIRSDIVDDGDGILTFWDFNLPANRDNPDVAPPDSNGNMFIDGQDLLADDRYVNGLDEDGNGLIDDLVGWDFDNYNPDPSTHIDELGNVKVAGSHGTGVAGIAAAIGDNDAGGRNTTDNYDFREKSGGVAGSCWRCRIMPIKAGGSVTGKIKEGILEKLLETGFHVTAMRYAVHMGADIINTSYSFGFYPDGADLSDKVKEEAYAIKSGRVWDIFKDKLKEEFISLAWYMSETKKYSLFVFSAGNNQANISDENFLSWAKEKEHIDIMNIGLAQGQTRVLIVGGLQSDGTKYPNSCYGNDVKIWAPAEDWVIDEPGNEIKEGVDGTSGSAPAVAGVAGLIISLYNLSPSETAARLLETIDVTNDGLPSMNAENAVQPPP